MRKFIYIVLCAGSLALAQSCHENPHNTFGGPSNQPKDTAISRRDTTSVGLRTDR